MFVKKIFENGFFPFHIVHFSPWPLVLSLSIFNFLVSILKSMNKKDFLLSYSLFFSFFFLLLCFFFWQKDILYESCSEGMHTEKVKKGLKLGFFIFLLSEVFFFFSLFWSLMYYKTSPSMNIFTWPSFGLQVLDPMGPPLLGTIFLFTSSITITWSHHSLLKKKWKESAFSLFLTISLGFSFSILQLKEYSTTFFSISDSVYGSIFFVLTGFHGLHVFIGSIFLFICFIRFFSALNFSQIQHAGFEMSIWYWHFVDTVWLFMYLLLYF